MKEANKPETVHKHEHHHHHNNLRGEKLLWATLLNLSITIVQIVGGVVSNSLSLLSDALHNLGDSSAIFIAFVAGKISRKKPDAQKTFGYKRVEILAALFNGIVLIAICIFLFYEAFQRFANPQPIKGKLMLIVATFGLLANLISVILLHNDKAQNLNVRAAYMHLLGDTLSSVAVIAGGAAIWFWNVCWLDPLITVLVGVYIIWHTWGIVKETVDILMQAVPNNIDLDEIKKQVEQIDGVADIHHLHVWKLDDSQVHLEAHLNLKKDVNMTEMMAVRKNAERLLSEKFGIKHITLQTGYNCCGGNNNLINSF
ncbi:cobalt-zinc-cadmium efflux system protein [Mariniphaga anaerophila]|uniref:Cobalt-zinc-cadmium efflux system protein n=1 Tax=Mariniphaga anaerophila TaxID=1484053 RepID=A0A1M5ABY8_9BACT|nr:cation diffusion facilitator family transporter [Mariniphaga anaerophila]SHF27769.1 cobalt-zinc-cadmium efflux system protein [Mariniphaga anaerophila]